MTELTHESTIRALTEEELSLVAGGGITMAEGKEDAPADKGDGTKGVIISGDPSSGPKGHLLSN
jgi:hypothetical protein